jgi:hypothetical protein
LLITGVAVEKVGSSEKSGKSGDGKCPGDWGKSFVELPDANRFLRICGERVFQQPHDLSTPTRNPLSLSLIASKRWGGNIQPNVRFR